MNEWTGIERERLERADHNTSNKLKRNLECQFVNIGSCGIHGMNEEDLIFVNGGGYT